MFERFNSVAVKVASFFYFKVFKRPISDASTDFVRNVGYLFLGTFGVSLVTFIINIFIVRLLGPTEYGMFPLILAIAGTISMPMLLGFDMSAIHFLARGVDKRKVIGTSSLSVVFLSLLFASIYTIFSNPLSGLFKAEEFIFIYAIIYALAYVSFTFTVAIYKGLMRMKLAACISLISNCALAIVALIGLFVLKEYSVLTPFSAHVLGNAVIGVFAIFSFSRFVFDFSARWLKQLARFAIASFGTKSLIILLKNVPLLLVNAFLGVSSLGVYAAYEFASRAVSHKLYTVFLGAFFPTVSKNKDKLKIFRMINKVSLIGAVVLFAVNFVAVSLLILVAGEKYPYYFALASAFALNAVLGVLYRVDLWLLSSTGARGAAIAGKAMLVILVLNVLLSLALIPTFELYGAVLSSIITHVLLIVFFKLKNAMVLSKSAR